MDQTLFGIALAVTLVAAIRSTWSPCGVSMLSTITPLAETGRGHSYRRTASWFLVGATLGGASLGLGAALVAAAVGTFDITAVSALTVVAAVAAIGAIGDMRLFGLRVPGHTRQVNELWFGMYRPWVYAGGFGWQIGVGLATFITTAAVYLMLIAAALTGEPLVALGLCTLFGFVRGLAVFAGARITTTPRLLDFHRRFDALAEPGRRVVAGFQVAVLSVAFGAAVNPAAGIGAGLAVAALLVFAPKAAPTRSLSDLSTAGPASVAG